MDNKFAMAARNIATFLRYCFVNILSLYSKTASGTSTCRNIHSLLNVKFNLFKGSTIKGVTINSELKVVSDGLGQLLAEPWRTVEGAARTGRTTTLAIPQWVVQSINDVSSLDSRSSVTEVVFPD